LAKQKRLQNRLEYLASTFALVLLSLYWLVIATYAEFYFVNPFEESSPLRVATLILSLIGWISISTLAPTSLLLFGIGKYKAIDFLPFAAGIWPVSILLSQLSVTITTGAGYWQYLIDNPIFLATDFIIPMALVALWLRLRVEHLDQ
jgi:hypothetical protein